MLVNEEVVVQYAKTYPQLCQKFTEIHDYLTENDSISHSRTVEGYIADLLTRIAQLDRLVGQYDQAIRTNTEDLLKAMNHGANEPKK